MRNCSPAHSTSRSQGCYVLVLDLRIIKERFVSVPIYIKSQKPEAVEVKGLYFSCWIMKPLWIFLLLLLCHSYDSSAGIAELR